jgi:hypothetical protein
MSCLESSIDRALGENETRQAAAASRRLRLAHALVLPDVDTVPL